MRFGLRVNSSFLHAFHDTRLVALVSTLVFALPVGAQIPDTIPVRPDTTVTADSVVSAPDTIPAVEVKAPPPPVIPPDLWKVGVDLALSAARGNQSFVILTTGGQLVRREIEHFSLELDGQVRYGRNGGEEIARRAQAGIKFDFLPKGRWSPFVFATGDHDAMRKLQLRLQSGAGAKFTFLSNPTTTASISVAGLYDREKVREQEPKILARWSWRAKAERTLGNSVKVQHTTLYQPGWGTLHDYLLTTQTGINTKLNQHVALTIAYTYDRDSTPANSAGPDDQALNVGLRFEF